MTRTTSVVIPRRLGLLGAAALVALGPALAAQAEPPPDLPPNIGLKVSKELQRQGSFGTLGEGALFDDSSATQCMHDDPEPLTYSTRELVIRADIGLKEAKQRVNKAIGKNGPGHAVSAKFIQLPAVPPAPETRGAVTQDEQLPLIVVSLLPDEQHAPEVKIVDVARKLRDHGTTTSPNYLMSPTAEGPNGVWPNGYPKKSTLVTPVRTEVPPIATGVKIFMYDVGLTDGDFAEIPPNVIELSDAFDDTELLDEVSPFGKVDQYYGGHTVAMSDVFATLAPGAEVKAIRVTNSRGLVTDVTAATRMAATLKASSGDPPEVIINSFGSPACDVSDVASEGEMVPLGLEAISEVIDARERSVLVAAAGNRSTERQFYPGAFDTDPLHDPDRDAVIGVGALDVFDTEDDPNDGMWVSPTRTGVLADFSNFGTWVDAWAPGVGLPVRHIKHMKFLLSDPEEMEGRGLVDGTSFAAPYVGALIAEQVGRSGQAPLDAWLEIASHGVLCATGGKAVALTAMTDTATTDPTEVGTC